MCIDPINWSPPRNRILEWAKQMCPCLTIPTITDQLFNERTGLTHPPRAVKATPSAPSTFVYHFFDPETTIRHELDHLIASGVPVEDAKLISKINKHSRNLSLIGILPNQLRTLIKRCCDEPDVVFEDISKVLFWEGYKIWKRRKVLNKNFWRQRGNSTRYLKKAEK